ncbi:MAG: 50S ribosomal protein L35 [Chloroflexi bacterium]|nr:50S ribosomal protein L35 [Chloroflexota bacterium]
MPKLKTHKGAKARFRTTGTGKMVRMKGQRNHFRRRKLAKVRRQYNGKLPVSSANLNNIRKVLPYGA